ncbi:COP9 signalosome complex subunit 8 [Panicum miliaceum]|uniref:COP9 signalosome complex subunit 8 n=1 Tax=Panicum miliaceum TaxID=4540 RepID=A0A3L6QPK5_PANMI|nr:COP9 signalosome complex subunit 8 [Panicum miliaceum]
MSNVNSIQCPLSFPCVTASRGATTDEWPYAVHLLAHLYLNDYDLNSARFFCKSLPQKAKDARPEFVVVWRIGQCL